jgi:hypothetical protein
MQVCLDHVVDSIAASAANTNDGDAWLKFEVVLRNSDVNGHGYLR